MHNFLKSTLNNDPSLLDFQQKEKQGNSKAFEILDRPVLETLYYASSQYKWNDATNNATANSPYKLMEMFKVSQSQFEWVALNERSRSQAWRDLEGIFEKKVCCKESRFEFGLLIIFLSLNVSDVARSEIEIIFYKRPVGQCYLSIAWSECSGSRFELFSEQNQ